MVKFGYRMFIWIWKKFYLFVFEVFYVFYLILGDIFFVIINLCGDGNRILRFKGVMYFRFYWKFLFLNLLVSKIFKSLSLLVRN